MKKLILFLSISTFIKGQTIVIDSILPKTTQVGSFINSPWPTSLNSYIKVYSHSTGTFSPTYPVNLYFNGNIVKSGTYQNLFDSSFVWGFSIPTCPTGPSGYQYYPVKLSGSTVNYQVHNCLVAVINEVEKYQPPIKTEYYNILGQRTEESDILIKIEYFEDGSVRRTKTIHR